MPRARAAVVNAVREPINVETLEVRDPRAGEVLVRLGASGVCHSDLHAITGDLPMPLPVVLGHEGAGTVEAVGPGVEKVKPGDHVILNWVPFCGACWYCRSGNNYLCQDGYVKALIAGGFQRDGGQVNQLAGVGSMAEYTLMQENGCIPIDADMPFDRACLIGCGVMTGVGAVVNTAQVRPGAVGRRLRVGRRRAERRPGRGARRRRADHRRRPERRRSSRSRSSSARRTP